VLVKYMSHIGCCSHSESNSRPRRARTWGKVFGARGKAFEAWGNALVARGNALETRGNALEARGNALEARVNACEARANADRLGGWWCQGSPATIQVWFASSEA
jgi:hypothetical protein